MITTVLVPGIKTSGSTAPYSARVVPRPDARCCRGVSVQTLALELGEHLALEPTFDHLQRERSHRLLHLKGDLVAGDYGFLDLPLPFGVGTGSAREAYRSCHVRLRLGHGR